MRSMTGYGAGSAPLGGGELHLELRTLNHRFVDVRVRLPPEIADQGSYLEQLVREKLERGRADVSVRLAGAALPPARFSIERARSLHRALGALRDELAPGTELTLATLASFSSLLLEPVVADIESVRQALARAFATALDSLNRMREAEGAALGREIGERLTMAKSLAHAIRERSGSLVARTQKRRAPHDGKDPRPRHPRALGRPRRSAAHTLEGPARAPPRRQRAARRDPPRKRGGADGGSLGHHRGDAAARESLRAVR